VCFALEGCLKEAALVSAGEATFSCPSITLWSANELEAFARNHLIGKQVLVICDSDWRRDNDDAVVMQTLLARDRLRLYGADAHAAAPPNPPECGHHDKHGVDDFLGPCTKGKVNDLDVIERETRNGLAEFIADNEPRDRRGRRVRRDGVIRDGIVLRYLATLAAEDGTTTVSLSAVARNLREELEASSQAAAERKVERAVKNLVRYEAVEEIDPIRKRSTGRRYRAEFSERRGELKITPSLRATTRLRTVRELTA
jgi:hypothetical protein